MGFKFLALQTLPWCFHEAFQPEELTGGDPIPLPAVHLILADGRVHVYHCAVEATELMAANPRHLVCRSDAFFIGQKVPSLSAGDLLHPGNIYFLLPSQIFASALSFVSLSSLSTSKLLLLRPFEIQKTAAGRLQLRVSNEFIKKLGEEDEKGQKNKRSEGMVCTTEKMEKEYNELVVGARIWKPKLETIRESERRETMMRRKKKSHKEQKY